MKHILVVDDEAMIRDNLTRILTEESYHVSSASTGKDALKLLATSDVDLVLLDLSLPDMHGIEVLNQAKELDPDLLAIVITGYASVESAVEALKSGAYDYIKKPFKADVIKLIVRLALETQGLKDQVGILKRGLTPPLSMPVIAESPQMAAIMMQIREVAQHVNATVLITGESGTGKEVVAHSIHQMSPRHDMPMLIINCATLPENLLESELFGYEKGAFTNADKKRKGLFEAAEGGTIFLDEIGEMPFGLQAKLLGVLERKSFRRIGGNRDIMADVRVIAATNIDPKKAILEKKFREDLYYRLNVFPIQIPPLRDRREDITLLSEMFLKKFTLEFHKEFVDIDPETADLLAEYPWPGNVRELRNVFERICIMHNAKTLAPSHLPGEIEPKAKTLEDGEIDIPGDILDIETAVEQVTRRLIKKAMDKTSGNTAQAARLLGIPRGTLRYKMKKYLGED